MGISNRLPKWNEALSVYAVIVMMVYSWTLVLFFYRLPGWLYTLTLNEIANILIYSLPVNLLESLVFLLGVVVFGAILPQKLFRDAFVARGASFSILTLGLMMYIASRFNTKQYYPAELIRWTPAILVGVAVVAFMFGRIPILRRPTEWLAEQARIFLYISIPASLLCLIVVVAQILF